MTIDLLIKQAIDHHSAGNLVEAEKIYRQILQENPQEPQALHFLGVIANQTGDLANAQMLISRALEINPLLPDACNNLGNILLDLGKTEDAIVCYQAELKKNPQHFDALFNLANLFLKHGQFRNATEHYLKAIEVNPHNADAFNDLGMAIQNLGDIDAAIGYYHQSIALKADHADANNNLGVALVLHGKAQEALEYFRTALASKTDFYEAHSNLIFALDLIEGIPLETHLAQRRHWDALHGQPRLRQRAYLNIPEPERRLRIGYVSADLRQHSAPLTFGAMLTHFDQERYEVFVYSNSNIEDAVTAHFQKHVTGWRKIVDLPDEAVDKLIRQDKIDILVDLSGHSSGNRLTVFAGKPAPIQITAWGYATGTGLKAIDYLFHDEVSLPPEEKRYYVEEVRYLPSALGFFCPDPFPPLSPLPASSAGVLTFGSLNRVSKLTPNVLRTWAKILKIVPQGRLLLKAVEFDSHSLRSQISDFMAGEGIAPDRLILMGKTSREEHLKTFAQVDITLDPFPHGGGITMMESVMMGVPVVTYFENAEKGKCKHIRGSFSLLKILGLTDWVAPSLEKYITLAAQKASDLKALGTLRSTLRQKMTSSIICDHLAYARSAETEYRKIWRAWCERWPNV